MVLFWHYNGFMTTKTKRTAVRSMPIVGLNLRLPRGVHAALTREGRLAGVSLNSLMLRACTTYLALRGESRASTDGRITAIRGGGRGLVFSELARDPDGAMYAAFCFDVLRGKR